MESSSPTLQHINFPSQRLRLEDSLSVPRAIGRSIWSPSASTPCAGDFSYLLCILATLTTGTCIRQYQSQRSSWICGRFPISMLRSRSRCLLRSSGFTLVPSSEGIAMSNFEPYWLSYQCVIEMSTAFNLEEITIILIKISHIYYCLNTTKKIYKKKKRIKWGKWVGK